MIDLTDARADQIKAKNKTIMEQISSTQDEFLKMAETSWDAVEDVIVDCRDNVVEIKEAILNRKARYRSKDNARTQTSK